MKKKHHHYLTINNIEVAELYKQYLADFENEAITFKEYLAALHVHILENICILLGIRK